MKTIAIYRGDIFVWRVSYDSISDLWFAIDSLLFSGYVDYDDFIPSLDCSVGFVHSSPQDLA